MAFFALSLFAYLLGSISFGLWVAKAKGVDLRSVGSGNVGATNVYRQLGLGPAALVFFLDGLKGWLPTVLAIHFLPATFWTHVVVGLCAILGHSLPVFAGFKGGKGAATGLGMLLALSPVAFFMNAIIAALIIWQTRYVSAATITVCILTPIEFWVVDLPIAYTSFVGIIGLVIIYRHKANIARLIAGNENKV